MLQAFVRAAARLDAARARRARTGRTAPHAPAAACRSGGRCLLSVALVCGLVLLALLAGPRAAEASGTAMPWQPIDLAATPGQLPLVEPLAILEDPGAHLSASEAAASPGWQRASRRALTRGYTRSAIWLAGELHNSSSRPVTRWLSVGPVRLEDVRYYVRGAQDQAPRLLYHAGMGFPIADRPIDTVLPVFPVRLEAGQRIAFLVRVQSRSAIGLNLTLWAPVSYWNHDRAAAMFQMLFTGSIATILLFALVLGIVWRDRVFMLLAASIVAEMIYELAFEGYLYQALLRGGGDLVMRLPSIAGNATVVLFTATIMAFIGLERIAPWKWIYRAMIVAMTAGAVWSAFGDYRVAASVCVQAVFVCNLVWVISMLDGWRRGQPFAKLLLLSFAPDCASLFLRLAITVGLLSVRWETGTAQAWDNLSFLLMMSLIMGGRARRVYVAQRSAQQALLDTQSREQERLEHAVETRTRELQRASIAADEANRSKADFLARVSHDLRTPLTSIIGFADLIQAAGRDDAQRGRLIRRSADHMLEMVNDLIDYAGGQNPDALRVEPVYVHALLDQLRQHGSALAARNRNAFRLEIDGELPPVLELDGRRVQQILGNLLDNAAKFTSDGAIGVVVHCRAADGDAVWLGFAVSDTGCGIAPADHERMFEPFTRLDDARHRPGIGLGLAIVQQWTQRMGGTLQVDSAPGRGTTIRVGLHARAVDETRIEQPRLLEGAAALPQIDGAGLRVLIAEDAAEIRALLREDLASVGFVVETAADGLAAIARIGDAAVPALDLVLTDHLMPGANGDAVLAAARRRERRLPVVAVSATPQARPADAGADCYDASLLKPVNLADLRNTIARILGLARDDARADDADDGASASAPLRPPEAELDEGRRLVGLGALSDLYDWADALVAADAACAPFAARVRGFVETGDLAGLQALLATGDPAAA